MIIYKIALAAFVILIALVYLWLLWQEKRTIKKHGMMIKTDANGEPVEIIRRDKRYRVVRNETNSHD